MSGNHTQTTPPYAGYSAADDETSAPQPLDRETLARLRADLGPGRDAFNELVGLFISELVPRLQAITLALERDDPRRIAAAAHILKGSSMLVGARAMAELCLEIELAAKNGTIEQADALMKLLREEAGRVARALAAA